MISIWENVEPLLRNIYNIILLYFILGAIGFYFINRNKPRKIANQSYLKFFIYFLIVNALFLCLVFQPQLFRYVAILITFIGFIEMIRLYLIFDRQNLSFYLKSTLIYLVLSIGFISYSILPHELILYTFLIVSIFDSFSQITGQLWGKSKIVPSISPNKTIGGVTGGIIVAVISSFLLSRLYDITFENRILLVLGTIVFAFGGDIMASLYKRKYGVKDYSRLIPGHGGVLDRFDSLVAAGAWVALFTSLH